MLQNLKTKFSNFINNQLIKKQTKEELKKNTILL